MPNENIKEQNIEKVFSVAYESFLSEGIEKTTQALIAHKTGLSLRTISRYFASKDEMVVLVAKYALDHSCKDVVSTEKLKAMGKNGIGLLQLYFERIKTAYLENPNVYLLRAEFDIYFARNKVFHNKIYDELVYRTNNRSILREIFRIGMEDNSIRCLSDIDMEVRLLCNIYSSFVCALAIKTSAQMESANIKTQFDLFFMRLLAQYQAK